MSITPLTGLVEGHLDFTVHVYVSRLWQHRGATAVGPIKHTDIVFQDVEGNYMYAEIGSNLVDKFLNVIEEGKAYEVTRFLVNKMKSWYKPVDVEFMIRFGRYTSIRELDGDVMDYPLCTYALTAIDSLPSPTDTPESFTDVVGIITGVTSLSVYHSATRSTPSTKRVVYLWNLSGYEISLVLWGERAIAFDGADVLRIGQSQPVVAIFVGTLVKPFEGRRALSGGAPCRWYINENLPEINGLCLQLQNNIPTIRDIVIPGQSAAEISAQVDLETKTVKELLDLDIWTNKKTKFYVTVVLSKLSPGERWWFHGCTSCGKSTIPYGASYKCPEKDCGATGGGPRYRICYTGTDGTGDVELVFFEKSGKELIGKPALTIMRSKVPNGMSVEDAIQFARTDQPVPRELASMVSRKFRLVVSVTTKSFSSKSDLPAYQVHRIDQQHGKLTRAALGRRAGLAIASTSTSGGGGGLSPSGDALAHAAGLAHSNSSKTVVDVLDAPISTDVPSSTVDSRTNVLQTPPSVTKPDGPSDGKIDTISNVKKALFQGPSPERGTGDLAGLAPPDVSGKVSLPLLAAPDSPLASSSATIDKTNNKRKVPTKVQGDGTGRKRK